MEASGRAGDVVLAHPLLLHARSANLGAVDDADAVRFGCFPNVPMRAPLRLEGGAATPVEALAGRRRRAGGARAARRGAAAAACPRGRRAPARDGLRALRGREEEAAAVTLCLCVDPSLR